MLVKLNAQKRITSLSIEDAQVLGSLFHSLQLKGNPIPTIDAIIGAIGISRELTIITTDQTHFTTIKKVNKVIKVEFW